MFQAKARKYKREIHRPGEWDGAMARAHEPDFSSRKPHPRQVQPSDFVIHGYGFNETHLLISGSSGSKREKGVLFKLKIFFQEALAQNRWISNLRNLFFPIGTLLCQNFHPFPGALGKVLRDEVTSGQSQPPNTLLVSSPLSSYKCL